jgi:bacillithiol biosynthesis deacetylase BshB1
MLDILAFGAHPDDVELFAGGTMAKMAALGYSTGIIDMTRGELGTRGTPAMRKRESQKAAKILGLKVRENLDLPDGALTVTPASRLKVIRALREYCPRVVLTHHWEDKHPDHVHTSRLVEEAVHHSGLAKIRTGQKRHRPGTLLFFKVPPSCIPDFVVDISEYSDKREAAIRVYQSQLFNPASRELPTKLSHPDFLANIETIHSYYGTLIHRRKGEAFVIKDTIEIRDLVDHFAPPQKEGIKDPRNKGLED